MAVYPLMPDPVRWSAERLDIALGAHGFSFEMASIDSFDRHQLRPERDVLLVMLTPADATAFTDWLASR